MRAFLVLPTSLTFVWAAAGVAKASTAGTSSIAVHVPRACGRPERWKRKGEAAPPDGGGRRPGGGDDAPGGRYACVPWRKPRGMDGVDVGARLPEARLISAL